MDRKSGRCISLVLIKRVSTNGEFQRYEEGDGSHWKNRENGPIEDR